MVDNQQIEEYKKEMETYPLKKKKLLIVALVLFAMALVSLIAFIILFNVASDTLGWLIMALFIFTILFVVLAITILILRYEVYLIKTANRMRIINKTESINKEKENPHSKDNKIGF